MLQVPTANLCQLLCDQNENCNYFTWYSSESEVFAHLCFHHSDCAQLDFKCSNCHAGPRSSQCPRRRNRRLRKRK